MDGLKRIRDKEDQSISWAESTVKLGDPVPGEKSREIVGVNTELQKQRLCQVYLMATPDGVRDDMLNTFDLWTNASDGKHLLEQLAISPFLIVDVKPEGGTDVDEYCLNRYGVTVDQLLDLAEQKLIGFNLLAFDSDKENFFENHRRSALIEAILKREAEGKALCWIGSMRRDAFFNIVGKRPFQEYLDEGMEKVRTPGLEFFELNEEELDADHGDIVDYSKKLRDNTKTGKTTASAYHYAYLRACGNDLVQEELDRIIGDGIRASEYGKVGYTLRGLKTAHATKFSASFGSQYRMSHGAFQTCTERLEIYAPPERRESLANRLQEGLRTERIRFLTETDEGYLARWMNRITKQMQDSLESYRLESFENCLPRPVDDRFFDDFINVVKEGRELRAQYNNLLNAVTRFRLDEDTVENIHDVLDDLLAQHKEVHRHFFQLHNPANRFTSKLSDLLGIKFKNIELGLNFFMNLGDLYDVSLPESDIVTQIVMRAVEGYARYPVSASIPYLPLYQLSSQNAVLYRPEMARLIEFGRRPLNTGRS